MTNDVVVDSSTNQSTLTMRPNISLLYAARGVRGFGDGFAIIILPTYLTAIGYGPVQIGIVATVSLLGTALLTLVIGAIAARYDLRTLLLGGACLDGMHRICISQCRTIRFRRIGGVCRHGQPIDRRPRRAGADRARHAGTRRCRPGANPHLRAVQPDRCTFHGSRVVSRCNARFLGAGRHRDGKRVQADVLRICGAGIAERGALSAFAPCTNGCTTRYRAARPIARRGLQTVGAFQPRCLCRRFLVQSLLALWLFERFDLSLSTASLFFFWSSTASAFSYPVAAWLAKRIGLINTMVFTHIPSSILLMLAAFSPDLYLTLGLLLVRSALSQMDVPTRTSYVMAVVTPAERAAAASFTAVPRSLASGISPALLGYC